MATGAGAERPAGPVSHGRLRASHADREQVIETLKAAFVQGRLTKEELDARAGQAFAARTYAELGTVIADLPAGLTAAPARPRRPMSKRAKIKWVALALALPVVLSSPHSAQLFFLLSPFFFMALAFLVAEAVAARLENHWDAGQLPPGRRPARVVSQHHARPQAGKVTARIRPLAR